MDPFENARWYAPDIASLRRALQMMEAACDVKAKEIDAAIPEPDDGHSLVHMRIAGDVPVPGRSPFEGQESFEIMRAHVVIPAVMRRSIFITVCACAEHWLNNMCDHVRHRRKVRLRFTDIHGQGIHRAQTYLTRAVGLTFPEVDASRWQHLCEYNKLRNVIVHAAGVAEDERARHVVQTIARRDPNLVLDKDEIVLNPGFCEAAIDCVEHFFSELTATLTPQLKNHPVENRDTI